MKKHYVFYYAFIALFLVFTSCTKDENEITDEESSEVVLEPDFF
ncbi:hypothetical protein [Aquimarina sp. 2201CG14-23]|nr:hypothetical protein [Aquimarina sp. 2201CG14-23]MDH7447112.1 hypothetical protein [Aquimarina sp. 2201CG14-23]